MTGLTLDKLKDIVHKANKKEGTGGGKFALTSFLPDGRHQGRFIVDPSNEIYSQYYSYGYFGKGTRTPEAGDTLPEGFVDELKDIHKELQGHRVYKYGPKFNMIFYFYLISTDRPSDNWKPGNLYAVIGDRKFSTSYINFITALANDAPEALLDSLNPDKSGVLLSIDYKFGRDGGCSIGAAFPQKTIDPLDLTDQVWVDLEQAYIRPGFDITRYNALLAEAKEVLEKKKEERAKWIQTKEGQAEVAAESKKEEPTQEEPQEEEAVAEAPEEEKKVTGEVDTSNPWAKYAQKE